ncbi:uncharacterized protein MEPE_05475 [Melanopsichium pennsylvanicum]|uniref:HhH-GPD domain-containing protein n=2 Tax=Melanopsichium pennsylvanicum TaxID=63383 RepID=A0AAJ4XRW6_9BASI|nr:pre-mrna splicing [Melanopsichium pennsylvanicum 4]SNX86766.1 uncharacterized protein MEPE_05475 [Melanopsichium pennsylvanicum]
MTCKAQRKKSVPDAGQCKTESESALCHLSSVASSFEDPKVCRSGAVRRSSRLRQRISPYLQDRKLSVVTPPISKDEADAEDDIKRVARARRKTIKAGPKGQNDAEGEVKMPTEVIRVHGLPRQVNFYGLIQELVTPNVFRLLVATCLLNQTKGRAAMPIFWELLRRWPDEHSLAEADVVELTELLQPIGLHNIRARRLISMSKTMVEIPYDERNSFKSRDKTAPDTPISIYPGVGRYAIDSWRIFVAGGGASVGLGGAKPVSPFDTCADNEEKPDMLIGTVSTMTPNDAKIEPEWKSVMPLDKELRAYLIWRWAKEGQVWDPLDGLVSAP